LLLLEEFRLQL
jgi:hypothetical protein